MALPVKGSASRVDVLGVGVDPVTVEGLQAEVGRLIRGRKRGVVLNANVRCLNFCYEDPELRAFLNGADLVFCDGAGVMLAARILGGHLPERITYADWAWHLAAFAETQGFSLYLLGARPGVAEKAASRLKARHPDLEIVGVRNGYFDRTAGSQENEAVVAGINAATPDILLVGLGMPVQEHWLMHNRDGLKAGVALTGGAVFDYVSGELRRGPRALTDNGFEWLARLVVEPRRLWRRYLIGLPLFMMRVLGQRLSRS
ncbi:MAG: WecB/TagA/CpsF family glycosyltransferase [Rubrobacter sp.]